MSIGNKAIARPALLIVEGKDEAGFINALIRSLGLPMPQIESIDGNEKFKPEFSAFWYSGDNSIVKKLGIIRDAEKNQAGSAHTSVCATLKSLGIPIPRNPGEILNSGDMKIGTFIMPNNENAGMLETLCLTSIENDAVSKCIDKYFECFSSQIDPNYYKKINKPKAKILAYLATKFPYSNSIDIASQKGHFDFSNSVFNDIKKFINDILS